MNILQSIQAKIITKKIYHKHGKQLLERCNKGEVLLDLIFDVLQEEPSTHYESGVDDYIINGTMYFTDKFKLHALCKDLLYDRIIKDF